MKCNTCNKEYTTECDYNQGRCPHHPPLLNIQPKDTSKGHFYVSIVKSIIRIGAGFGLMFGFILFAGMALVFAEILGIVEEIV